MTEEHDLEFSIIYECISTLEREAKYWSRINLRSEILKPSVAMAKRLIAEEVYKLAAAAATRIQQKSATENLWWSYRALIMEIKANERRREGATPTNP